MAKSGLHPRKKPMGSNSSFPAHEPGKEMDLVGGERDVSKVNGVKLRLLTFF